jgi:hypothetical protein
MSEHRRKTLRSFYCEEQLWQAFERASREGDATIDQLLNDALRQYLGQATAPAPAGYAATMAPAPAPPRPPTAQMPAVPSAPAAPAEHPTFAMPAVPRRPGTPAPAPAPAPPTAPGRSMQPTGSMPPVPPAPPRATGAMPAAPAPPPPRAQGMPSLFVHFDGRSYPVAKAEFIIGRGSQGTDLKIPDQNVSRKHASVLFHGGAFWIQDLGSTNGVEFRGQRVDSRRIEEGDVYTICEHEIAFSYRG